MLGFGFVGFQSEEVVEQVCQTHFHQLNGKTVCAIHLCALLCGVWADALHSSASGRPLTFVLCSLSQVEVKKAEPRYATASVEAYRASMGAGMSGFNSQANYGGMIHLPLQLKADPWPTSC